MPVHRMTEDLLRLDTRGSLPGLRDFARRVGVCGVTSKVFRVFLV